MTGDEIGEVKTTIRIHVGGLGETVTDDDLRKIFSSMGTVCGVDIVRTKGRSFAYVDFSPSDEKSLVKIFSTYNGCVWKGGRMRLEKAKEDYLSRLKREWEENAKLESSPAADEAKVDTSTVAALVMPNRASLLEKEHLRIFFPGARKVKPLPFGGSGKHKYSFQRVEVPPLPKYFCDCEEHSTLQTVEVKHIENVEPNDGGVNEEELNMMQSIMNRLLQTKNDCKTAPETEVADEDDDDLKMTDNLEPDESELDLDADEDNIVLNLVSKPKTRLSISTSRKQENVSTKQESISRGKQTLKSGSMEDVIKELKTDSALNSKKRKINSHEESGKKKSVPAKPESETLIQAHSNTSETKSVSGSRLDEPKLGAKHSTKNLSWTQKSSWKALVGDKGKSLFSVSNILSGAIPTEKEQARSGDQTSEADEVAKHAGSLSTESDEESQRLTKELIKERKKNNAAAKKRKKSVIVGSKGGITVDPLGNGVFETQGNELGVSTIIESEPTGQEPCTVEQSASDHSSPKSTFKAHDGAEGKTVINDSDLYVDTSVAKEKPFVSHSSNVTDDIHAENQDMTSKDDTGGKSGGDQVKVASNESGRGSAWLHKSSWTQLVKDNSSFSFSQILPDLNFETKDSTKPSSTDVPNFIYSQYSGTAPMESNIKEDKPPIIVSEEKKAGQSFPDTIDPTVLGNKDTSVLLRDEEFDRPMKPTVKVKASIGETCSFMRSDASLKEWAKVKKSLSGPLKRKSIQK